MSLVLIHTIIGLCGYIGPGPNIILLKDDVATLVPGPNKLYYDDVATLVPDPYT